MFRKHFGLIIITVLVLLISISNFKANTYLSGWDNLHPEFNFGLNIKRSIFGGWQEYQGLGLIGGMGHAADLVRQIFLWIASLFLPLKFLRYFYHFSMLLTGTIGTYFLLRKILLKSRCHSEFISESHCTTEGIPKPVQQVQGPERLEGQVRDDITDENLVKPNFDVELGSIVGSILYLLNLATLQMFFVPFEPFSHHFAAIPWIFYGNLNYIFKSNKRNLILLFAINLLATPQGYVATYFLVTTMCLFMIFGFYLIRSIRSKKQNFKRLFSENSEYSDYQLISGSGAQKIRHLILRISDFLRFRLSEFSEYSGLKKVIVCLFIFFSVNAFWLLPNMYFLVFKSNVNVNAKINQMSTEDNFLKNKEYGDLANTALFKNFWFDSVDVNKEGSTIYQLSDWIYHLNNPFISAIGYLIFVISIIGIILAIKKKVKNAVFFIPLFLLSFTIIANDSPVFSQISGVFYKLPLFSQIFRFPFTKFGLVAVLCLAIFYSVSFMEILKVKKIAFSKINKIIVFCIFALLPITFMSPVFLGKFFDEKNKINIPDYYFKTFDFFKKQEKTGRIANFPQFSYWGWSFYRWGYRGSGLLWYGVEQPTLDRAFDVWSRENENYYNEIYFAVYSNNLKLFESLLEKYNIRWVLIDESVISYANQKQIYFTKLKDILDKSKKTSLEAKFDKIKIYKTNVNQETKNYVSIVNNLPLVEPAYKWNNYDLGYAENGNYVSISNFKVQSSNSIYYPFRSLFTGKNQNEIEFQVQDRGNYFSFTSKIPKKFNGGTLILPKFYEEELMELDINNLETNNFKYPSVFIDNEPVFLEPKDNEEFLRLDLEEISDKELSIVTGISLPPFNKGILEIKVPKIKGFYSFNNQKGNNFTAYKPSPCNPFNVGKFKHNVIKEKGSYFLNFQSLDSSNCLDIDLPELSHRLGYLVNVESKNIAGKSLLFAVINDDSERSEIETYLPRDKSIKNSYFIIPPMAKYGLGYKLHFDNISIGRVNTINNLGKINVNPIPYRFLTSLQIIKLGSTDSTFLPGDIKYNVEHPNPSFYKVGISNEAMKQFNNETLVLSQSYDEGWKAYSVQSSKFKVQSWVNENFPFLFGKEIKDHVLVNNWSNGWVINNSQLSTLNSQLIIVFWPQYLEYLGFGLLIIGPIFILKFHKYLS